MSRHVVQCREVSRGPACYIGFGEFVCLITFEELVVYQTESGYTWYRTETVMHEARWKEF